MRAAKSVCSGCFGDCCSVYLSRKKCFATGTELKLNAASAFPSSALPCPYQKYLSKFYNRGDSWCDVRPMLSGVHIRASSSKAYDLVSEQQAQPIEAATAAS